MDDYEYRISNNEIKKIFHEEKMGKFDEMCISGNTIGQIDRKSLLVFNKEKKKRYAKFQNNILQNVRKMTEEKWGFEIRYYFKGLRYEDEFFCQDYCCVLIIYNNIAVDYISIVHIEDLYDKLKVLKEDFSNINNTSRKVNIENLPLVFHNSAAAGVTHEVMGHILEIDNFMNYDYGRFIETISSLKLDIIDRPFVSKAIGTYLYDDMGLAAKETVLFQKGIFTSSLIGGECKTRKVRSSFRRDDFSHRCLPRMSNLLVTSYNIKKRLPDSYIQINTLSKNFLFHATGDIEFNVGCSFICNRKNGTRTFGEPFSIKVSLKELLESISAISGNDSMLRPLRCAKQGQVVDCTASSPDWVLEYGKYAIY